MKEWTDPETGTIHCFSEQKHLDRHLSEKELRKKIIEDQDIAYFKNMLFNPMKFPKLMEDAMVVYHLIREKSETVEEKEEFTSTLDVIAEVERLAPEFMEQVEDILESKGFNRAIPLNDKWALYVKKVVMPTWKLLDVETWRPIEAKNVTVEFAIKVHREDLFLKSDDWRVISDGKWHEAKFIDNEEETFEVML